MIAAAACGGSCSSMLRTRAGANGRGLGGALYGGALDQDCRNEPNGGIARRTQITRPSVTIKAGAKGTIAP